MPKNEDGEFELVLGNKQLLSMFFVVVVLLGVFFVMGYIVGRNSAPLVTTDIVHKPDSKPTVVDSPAPKAVEPEPAAAKPVVPEKAPEKAPEPVTPPTTPAPAPKAAAPAKPAPAPVTKAEPPKAEPPTKKEAKAEKAAEKAEATAKAEAAKAAKAAPPAGGQPLPGAIYLQLSATDKADADKVVETLRKNNFPALDKEVPEKLGTFRVLVGPIPAGDVNKVRADLQSKSFNGNGALKKTF